MLKEMMQKNMKIVSIFFLLLKKLEIVIIMYKLLFIKKNYVYVITLLVKIKLLCTNIRRYF